MRKEVPPVIAFAGILLTLTVVQVLYWRGMIGHPSQLERPRAGKSGGSRGDATGLPEGLAEASVTTIAGRPDPGHRDGPAAQALFDGPVGVATDRTSTIYLADSGNHCVRVLSANGRVSTFAGRAGQAGHLDGPGEQAAFSAPAGLALAPDGRLFVADTGNHCIRCITQDGVVSTYAGGETPADELGRPLGAYRDGPADQAQFCYPVDLKVDESGTVYVADAGNHRVRRISPSGRVTTLPISGGGDLKTPTGLCLAPGNQIWVADTSQRELWVGPRDGPLMEWRPTGGRSGLLAPAGIAVSIRDKARPEVYVADAGNHCLWRVDADQLTLMAGVQDAGSPGWEDGPGNGARFSCPAGLASGRAGELYVADFGNNCLRRVSLAGGAGEAR